MDADLKQGAACTGSGAALGAVGHVAFGSAGLVAGGGAVSLGLVWFVAAGAIVGLAAYGAYSIVRQRGKPGR